MTFFSRIIKSIFVASYFSGSLASVLNLDVNVDKLGVELNKNNKIGISSPGLSSFDRQKVAREFIRHLRASGKVLRNEGVQTYIQNLGEKLLKSSGFGRKVHFLVLKDRNINAFAGLGGIIAINSGMIMHSRTEGELASVLAHEIAHVTQRHIERAIENNKSMGTVVTNAMLLALAVAAGQKNSDLGKAAITVASGLQIQNAINYTRLHEVEADAIGVELMSKAGYKPQSMINMFSSLMRANRFSNSKLPSFLSTHPLSSARIAQIKQKSKALPRGRSMMQDDFKAVRAMLAFETGVSLSGVNSSSTKVAKAINMLALGQKTRAQNLINSALARPTTSVYFKLLVGNYYSQLGQLTNAHNWYQKAYRQRPNNTSVNVKLAKLLLRQKKLSAAKSVITSANKKFKRSPEIKKLMAAYFAQKGNLAESYYWRAEYEFLSGYTKRAIIQLMVGKRHAKNNFYLTSRIEGKIMEYERIANLEGGR